MLIGFQFHVLKVVCICNAWSCEIIGKTTEQAKNPSNFNPFFFSKAEHASSFMKCQMFSSVEINDLRCTHCEIIELLHGIRAEKRFLTSAWMLTYTEIVKNG